VLALALPRLYLHIMKKRKRRRAVPPLPLMMAELTWASWETVARRAWMMADGSCTTAEYQRMVLEKTRAAQRSAFALMLGGGGFAEALAPWHGPAVANARRLRRKK
jgi:hypothetical protein